LSDGNFPATDGSSSATHFTGPRIHHQVPTAGHNLPQEAPEAFAQAVTEALALADDQHPSRRAVGARR
jgi:pimeloyl-ACP methyl ester carboxylesterase